MIHLEKIFTDEAQPTPSLQIDFSRAIWATNRLNQIFHDAKTPLSDVDFVVETEDAFLFIECKNSNRIDAVNSNLNNPNLEKWAKKFYDSLNFLNFAQRLKNKKKICCFIIEAENGDTVLRNRIKNILADMLPFALQKRNNFPSKMIDELEVLSFSEWNEKFPQFPLKRLIAPLRHTQ